MPRAKITRLRCSCGSVEVEAVGAPILTAACYCDDCQAGARRIEALPNAHPVTGRDGGTEYLLYRKDRIAYKTGADLLKRYKLRDTSPTNRVVATCCNTAMLVNFDRGLHWVSLYRARVQGETPALEMRVNTRFKPPGAELPADVPIYASYPLRFVVRLVAARIAMLFGR